MLNFRNLLLFIVLSFLAACSQANQAVVQGSDSYTTVQTPELNTLVLAETPVVSKHPVASNETPIDISPTWTGQPTIHPTLVRDAWKYLPVVPDVSVNAREIYQRGVELGNDPHRFSKVGDCQNVSSYFMGIFENPDEYQLGPDYAYLQETIDYYQGSFSRTSYSVKGGYNVAAILTPLRADQKVCGNKQSPLECELNDWRPSIAIVSLEEWWADRPVDDYSAYLDKAIQIMIDKGTLPIMATRAGNTVHVYALNDAIARVAHKHDVPLWNFWSAIQPLPNRGLTEDGFHLTFARNIFSDPLRMKAAWPWRNLTALQVLHTVRLAVETH